MLYRFKSKAGADVLMLADSAHPLLQLMGREPSAQGILANTDLPALLVALEAAVAADDAAFEQACADARTAGDPPPRRSGVTLRQRAWPLRELMRRASAEGHDIVWGV